MRLPDPWMPDTEVLGIYCRGAEFERLVAGLNAAIDTLDPSVRAVVMRFPPVLARRTVERCGYLHSFPHLLGTVHAFAGDDRAHAELMQAQEAGGDWSAHQAITDVVMTPAACYAVYPQMSGALPSSGVVVDVESWCFRQEPSQSLDRMRAFRMREFVRFGAPAEVEAWRAGWVARAEAFLARLGLEPSLAPANDPFFGAGGRWLAMSQREQELKFELSVEVVPGARTAAVSCNYHLEHFGAVFDIRTDDGQTAHTACVGFGFERLVLALYTRYGATVDAWPAEVRSELLV